MLKARIRENIFKGKLWENVKPQNTVKPCGGGGRKTFPSLVVNECGHETIGHWSSVSKL